jgi:hypothetical protein
MNRFKIFSVSLLAGLALLLGSGCETDDEDYDHDPPLGQGSIIIENFTSTDIEFFVGGRFVGEVDDDDDRAFDFRPGVYRVVLNDDDGDRSWAADVDVLEGRLTILTVRIDVSSFNGYDVTREIE